MKRSMRVTVSVSFEITTKRYSHCRRPRLHEVRACHLPLRSIQPAQESQLGLLSLYCRGGLGLVPDPIPCHLTLLVHAEASSHYSPNKLHQLDLVVRRHPNVSICCGIGVDSSNTESSTDPTLPARRILSPSFTDSSM